MPAIMTPYNQNHKHTCTLIFIARYENWCIQNVIASDSFTCAGTVNEVNEDASVEAGGSSTIGSKGSITATPNVNLGEILATPHRHHKMKETECHQNRTIFVVTVLNM